MKIKYSLRNIFQKFARYILRDELAYYQERDNCSKNKINISLSLFISILKQLPNANNFGKGTTTVKELRNGKEFFVFDELLGFTMIKLRFKRITTNSISVEAPEYHFEIKIPLKHITLNFSEGVEVTTFAWDIANCNVGCVLDRWSERTINEFITTLQQISAC